MTTMHQRITPLAAASTSLHRHMVSSFYDNKGSKMAEAVRVIVRCRPLNDREKNLNCSVVVNMDRATGQVVLSKPGAVAGDTKAAKTFSFDGVYYVEDTTEAIYAEMAFPLVDSVVEGYNGTVFAYGQTGCGKSFTMMGIPDPSSQLGVIPRVFQHVFDRAASTTAAKFLMHASYLEIYNEEVRDLLGKDVKHKLDLKEHPTKGVYVQGLSKHRVSSIANLEKVLELGSKNRSVGATLMNVDSSRSHSIFTIEVESSQPNAMGKEGIRVGKLNLVDLAGSERQSKTGSTGERLKEATKINLSLSALGNVISALVDGKSKHVPYRDSKLTRLLQSSLGGNTKTLMVSCISPADNNYDETLSTLRYANRAKNIKNKPRINEDPKDALLREYQEEIKRLKEMLGLEPGASLDSLGGRQAVQQPSAQTSPQHLSLSPEVDFEAERQALRQKYEQEIAAIKQQYSEEQEAHALIQQQLKDLQAAYQRDIDSLSAQQQQQHDAVAPPTDSTAVSGGVDPQLVEGSLNGAPDLLAKLQQLEGNLVGGEAAGDEALRMELDEKRRVAEERQKQVQEAGDMILDDDEILVKIYNSLTEEVSAKHAFALRERERRLCAEEDIKDLQAEFQEERAEFLETIRRQERMLQLQEQLLATVVPCLRRDCNYYYIDRVRSECQWDADRGEWVLPKLTITRTELKSIAASSSVSTIATNVGSPKMSSSSYNSSGHTNQPSASLSDGGEADDEEDGYLTLLSRRRESDYFKPKRAVELLAQTQHVAVNGGGLGEEVGRGGVAGARLQPLRVASNSDPLAVVERAERMKKRHHLQPINKPPF